MRGKTRQLNIGEYKMKKLLLTTLAALTLSTPVHASTQVNNDPCALVSGLAKSIMVNRQQNADLSKMMEIAGRNAEIKDVVVQLIKFAYKRPAYSVKSNQEREVSQFANDVYMLCLEGK